MQQLNELASQQLAITLIKALGSLRQNVLYPAALISLPQKLNTLVEMGENPETTIEAYTVALKEIDFNKTFSCALTEAILLIMLNPEHFAREFDTLREVLGQIEER